jgi:hypothetical protein
MNHAKTSFSTEIFSFAIINVVQYLAPLGTWFHTIYRKNELVIERNLLALAQAFLR